MRTGVGDEGGGGGRRFIGRVGGGVCGVCVGGRKCERGGKGSWEEK